MYCVNLVFSYPLSIYPTNVTLEGYLFSKLKEGATRYWLCNLSRFFVCFAACFCSITFESILDEFLGLTGSILGIPIILIVPTVCHYNIVAETKREKTIDLVIIGFSCIVLCFCSYMNSATFINEFRKDYDWKTNKIIVLIQIGRTFVNQYLELVLIFFNNNAPTKPVPS